MNNMIEKYGPWALVTGASRGLGRAFCLELSQLGFNIVMVSRSAEKLQELKQELSDKSPVQIRTEALDLALPDSAEKLFQACADIDVGLLINNAGIFPKGYFEKLELSELLQTVRLNCLAPLELTHRFTGRFQKRKKSGIIFVSSMQAFGAVPFMSNYSATKAYDMELAEGLRIELSPLGIDVLSLTPGFINRPGKKDGTGALDPDIIARQGLHKLGKKLFHTTGIVNKIYYHAGRLFLTRSFRSRLMARLIQKSMPRRKR